MALSARQKAFTARQHRAESSCASYRPDSLLTYYSARFIGFQMEFAAALL
jgi:hypothetical protein